MPAIATMRPPAPAKVKILEAASELFYQEGIHSVGVDRIISRANVTKATFYKHYRSKDTLIIAYVRASHDYTARLIENLERENDDPVAVLRAILDTIAETPSRPFYFGDPFINAAAQFPDPSHPVRQEVARHRRWEREKLTELLARAGYPDPAEGAEDVLLVRDGVLSGSSLGDPDAARGALRRAAARLIAACRG